MEEQAGECIKEEKPLFRSNNKKGILQKRVKETDFKCEMLSATELREFARFLRRSPPAGLADYGESGGVGDGVGGGVWKQVFKYEIETEGVSSKKTHEWIGWGKRSERHLGRSGEWLFLGNGLFDRASVHCACAGKCAYVFVCVCACAGTCAWSRMRAL